MAACASLMRLLTSDYVSLQAMLLFSCFDFFQSFNASGLWASMVELGGPDSAIMNSVGNTGTNLPGRYGWHVLISYCRVSSMRKNAKNHLFHPYYSSRKSQQAEKLSEVSLPGHTH